MCVLLSHLIILIPPARTMSVSYISHIMVPSKHPMLGSFAQAPSPLVFPGAKLILLYLLFFAMLLPSSVVICWWKYCDKQRSTSIAKVYFSSWWHLWHQGSWFVELFLGLTGCPSRGVLAHQLVKVCTWFITKDQIALHQTSPHPINCQDTGHIPRWCHHGQSYWISWDRWQSSISYNHMSCHLLWCQHCCIYESSSYLSPCAY